MARYVKPVKAKKVRAADVPIGSLFALNGVRYVKLAEENRNNPDLTICGVLATTVLPLCEFDSVYHKDGNKCIEERAVCMFMAGTTGAGVDNDGIVNCGMPDTDDFRQYGHVMRPHIKDTWYVDMGAADVIYAGEYFFVDEFCILQKSNEYTEKRDSVSRRLGVRAFCAIDPNAVVTVCAEKG